MATAGTKISLGDYLDEVVLPALFERLDEAFPEFGWERTRDGWVATGREATKRALDARPERVVCNRPFGFYAHGGGHVTWLAHVNGGQAPRGEAFVECVRRLCALACVPFPEREVSPEETRAHAAAEQRRHALEAVLRITTRFYGSPEAAAARTYLAGRGFDDEAAKALGFGFYPSVAAVRQALAPELHAVAKDAGLLWEKLEGYVLVPWRDAWGRPLTVCGRWQAKEPPAGKPKTVSLPGAGTRSAPLYLDRARAAGHQDLVLVEGVLDAALLQAKGDTRVVASGSANLGRAQVDALARLRVRSVTVCLDPDEAGDRGTLATVQALEAAGLAAYVAPRLPDGTDPDDLVLRQGVDAWRAHVARAVSGTAYRVEHALRGVTPQGSVIERDRAVTEVRALLAARNGDGALERSAVVQRLVEATGLKARDVERALKHDKPAASERAQQRAQPPAKPARRVTSDGTYREGPEGIVWVRQRVTKDGGVETEETLLCNFTARIVTEVVEDDGAEQRRFFEVEGRVGEVVRRVRVPAATFADLAWVVEELGAGAILETGPGVRDRVRHAIQTLSGRPPQQRVFAHLGWAEVDGERAYLHAGGAIGKSGPVDGVRVRLDAPLDRFVLPAPPAGEELVRAVEASLRLLDVAPRRITIPLFASVWRPLLGPCDFSPYLVGATGTRKTSLAALPQQHYGAELDHHHLPGSWESTGNALESLAFLAKDTLLVIDDFIPTGSAQDRARKHKDADRVLRGQGNRAGRQRCRVDATLRPARLSRSLLMCTGEELPRGESLLARMLTLPVGPGDVDLARLSRCQADAAAGLYASTLAAVVRWLASHTDPAPKLTAEVAALRAEFADVCAHGRALEIGANLLLGLRLFARFAEWAGVLSAARAKALLADGRAALREALAVQRLSQVDADPLLRFFQLARTVLDSGRGHVAGADGRVPAGAPQGWGWRLAAEGKAAKDPWHPQASESEPLWEAQGDRLGWVAGDDLYLDLDACLTAVQRVAGEEGFTLSRRALSRRLREKGLLRASDEARETHSVRVVLDGVRRTVLHLGADLLIGTELDEEAA